MDVEWAADDQHAAGDGTRAANTPIDRQHDIRAAASTILWLVRALGSDVRSEQERARALDGIAECARTITGLADDDTQPPTFTAVRLDELVRAAAERARLAYSSIVTVDTVPAIVRAPELDIVRLLENLVANACRAARGEGMVRMSVASRGDWVITEIVDTGPGIDDAVVEKGRGLTIVATLVEQLGGRLRLTRVGVDGGTNARVELPRAPAGHVPDAPSPESLKGPFQ